MDWLEDDEMMEKKGKCQRGGTEDHGEQERDAEGTGASSVSSFNER